MGRAEVDVVWRRIRPIAQRRVVLMARESGRNLWFEALRTGVATVLPFPPREAMVQAALRVVTRGNHPDDWRPDDRR